MVDDEVAFWPATRQVQAVRTREFSARELVELYAARIDRLNPAINAVVTVDVEGARKDADAVDARVARGLDPGPLAGAVVTIKDAIEVGSMRSTSGSTVLRDHVPAHDAPAVASLRAAGAVILGKTNLPAWCMEDPETHNELFGTTHNPWDLSRTVGGSSGGSAAAVAAGLSSADIGTDIGGSVRIPSHYCGTYALKPSYGVVPQLGYLSYEGSGRLHSDMNTFGPIARSADDLELLLSVIVGPDPDDTPAWRAMLPPPRRARIDEYRVGIWFDEPDCPIGAEYLTALGRAVDDLRAVGVRATESHPDVSFREQVDLWMTLAGAANAPGLPAELQEAAGGTHLQWLRNHERRQDLRATWRAWFDDFDALLCPVVLSAAHPHNLEGDTLKRTYDVDGTARNLTFEVPRWCGLINVIGYPSCVVPIGRNRDGLPLGMQIVTAYLRDRDAIDLARRMQDVVARFEAPPLEE